MNNARIFEYGREVLKRRCDELASGLHTFQKNPKMAKKTVSSFFEEELCVPVQEAAGMGEEEAPVDPLLNIPLSRSGVSETDGPNCSGVGGLALEGATALYGASGDKSLALNGQSFDNNLTYTTSLGPVPVDGANKFEVDPLHRGGDMSAAYGLGYLGELDNMVRHCNRVPVPKLKRHQGMQRVTRRDLYKYFCKQCCGK